MPDREFPDRADVRIYPPAMAAATVIAGIALQRMVPIGLSLPAPARYLVGGFLVLGAALGLGMWALIHFRRTGQNENTWKPTPGIIEQGPFRVTRNPMYLQLIVGCVGFAIVLSNVWVLLLTPVCAAILQRYAIRPEEAYLERKFGDAYRAYARRVRRWL